MNHLDLRFLAVLIALIIASPARAQTSGRITDPNGQPIAGARVELWSGARLVSAEMSDSVGVFRFAQPGIAEATAIVASRAGYHTRSERFQDHPSARTLVLTPRIVQLPGIVVGVSSTPLCPNRDDREARALWGAASRRYEQIDTLTIAWVESFVAKEGAWQQVGSYQEAELLPNRRMTGPQRRMVEPRAGYGFRQTTSLSPDFGEWFYYLLDSNQAQHFIDASFGAYNSFSIRTRDAEGIVLAFCSRNLSREAVRLEGTLTLSHDTTIVSAQWEYVPPRSDERAGGEAYFLAHPGGGSRPWLVPATSLYWRSLPSREHRYFHRWQRFEEWVLDEPFRVR
jgi:hypothetical protein